MTGSQIKEFTENILDGQTIDSDFYYQLLNIAKTKLEEKRLWQFLKKVDSSNTASSNAITLPTDFASEYKVQVGTDNEYYPVSFEEQFNNRNTSKAYFINHASGTLTLLGNPPSQTLYLFYKRFTDDIASGTSPVFPARFHPILGYYVASYFMNGVDTDDMYARMSPENRLAAIELEKAMIDWDTTLAFRSQGDTLGVSNSDPVTYLGDM